MSFGKEVDLTFKKNYVIILKKDFFKVLDFYKKICYNEIER